MDKGQQQQQEVRAALAEVERALSVLFGAPAPAGLDREAAHRFLQVGADLKSEQRGVWDSAGCS